VALRLDNILKNLNADQINEILSALQAGDIDHETATDQLFTLVYHELHDLASFLMKGERSGHSLQTTGLVHEAYLKLVRDDVDNWENRAHFFGVAARAMRQILVNHARHKQAAKRGGNWDRITLNENIGLDQKPDLRILDLDSALTRFAKKDERMARIAELRIFGGMRVKEVALVVGVSRSTVQGDWRVAKMWLNRELALDKMSGGAS